MDKKPLFLMSTDWHLKENNVSLIKDLIDQKIKVAKEYGIGQLIALGDIFDSRISQRQSVLNAFHEILLNIEYHGLYFRFFPGNHDKTDYSSFNSFLIQYHHHPNTSLYNKYSFEDHENNIRFHFMPFFEEKKWLQEFQPDLLKNGKNICFTHVAITGSKNNDGTEVDSILNLNTFKGFDLVLSGHYHDPHNIGDKFYHIPALYQQNYGENEFKGFTVLYDDLSQKSIYSSFPKYIKKEIDLNKCDNKSIAKEIESYSKYTNTDNVRFVFKGDKSKLQTIDKNLFLDKGIDVKKEETEISIVNHQQIEIKKMQKNDIMHHFEEFCKENEYDYQEGLKYSKIG